MTIRRRILVSGDVQGVFFRDTCRRMANELGVGGSARNLPDGRVEVVLEGDEDGVSRVIDWCRSGPAHAEVSSINVIEEEPEGISGFSIEGW
jgi:acylphosphatase